MRSTLLFVAVLLACTPMHAQAAVPNEAPILNHWLSAIFPVPASETSRRIRVKRTTPSTHPIVRVLDIPARSESAIADFLLPQLSATLLLHDPNAP